LTILATDPSGKKVDTEDLPFKEISVQPSGEAADREAADHARSVDEQAEHVDSVHEESEQKHSDNDEKQ